MVADVKHTSLETESGAEMYVPYLQKPYPFMGLVVRTASEPTQMTNAVRSAILAVDPSQPVYDVKTMQQLVGESVSQPRLYTALLGIFAGVALALAAVGIYGVLNYSVNQRRQEIGIRMALGAQASDILKMIVGHGMLLTAMGLAIGLSRVAFAGVLHDEIDRRFPVRGQRHRPDYLHRNSVIACAGFIAVLLHTGAASDEG